MKDKTKTILITAVHCCGIAYLTWRSIKSITLEIEVNKLKNANELLNGAIGVQDATIDMYEKENSTLKKELEEAYEFIKHMDKKEEEP